MCNCCKDQKELIVQSSDHREIGKNLGIFTFDELIGAGFPIWLENGNTLKEIIANCVNLLQKKYGITMVKTPILGTKQLYETSGHLHHYKENIFPTIAIENKEFILRPMTCPHHILLLKQKILTHKSFPVAYGENAMLYRYEYSGGLFGLERVRSMELIDTHIFVLKNQIEDEISKSFDLIMTIIELFDIKIKSITLSKRDKNKKDKFFNDDALWINAENQLGKIIEKKLKKYPNLNSLYSDDIGGAAFYGPKIDFQIETTSKKEITISTIQLDFLLPKKFDLTYKQEEIIDHPVIIHLGIIGTLERFIAYLLERYQGKLPLWLSPIQIMIIPINNEIHESACQKLKEIFNKSNIRAKIDLSNNTFNKKISNSQKQKIPFQILIGNKESDDLTKISYKKYGEKNNEVIELEKFIKQINDENNLIIQKCK